MTVEVNGGTLEVTQKSTVTRYKQDVWFDKKAIANKIALKNFIKKYWVTYNNIDQIFVVHREDQEKPSMEFNINTSAPHCYITTDKAVVLINNVCGNKQGFSEIQINGAEHAKNMYAKIGYPLVKYFRWYFKAKKHRLSFDSPRYWHCTCNLGQENFGFKREDQ